MHPWITLPGCAAGFPATFVFASAQSVHKEVFSETLIATNGLKPEGEKYLSPSAVPILNTDNAQFTMIL